ncbi:cellulase family glycosylhydrolase [Micromonospora sp. NPDC049114]|uniref:cellulase family glycosylhydrolase n=1 Tax=unclassified Micromonospora TaxID=2617518 RepID=UPI0033DA4709
MKSILRKVQLALVSGVLALAASATMLTGSASADSMAQLNATQLVADMGAGWNLGNALEANINGIPSETAWGNPVVTQAFIDRVKAAGFKTIRIPVSYLGNIGSAPDYTINPAWLNRIQEIVDYAYGRGLYVLINIHGDGFKTVTGSWLICDSSNQTTIRDKYQKVWQQIATRFQSYGERLIFEAMNEEFDGQYGNPTQPCYSNINAYNQIFVDTVRRTGGNNTSRWLLVAGWNTNIDYTAGNYGFVLPTDQYRSPSVPADEQRLMISVHYYDPWDFAGEENGTITQWGPAATNPARKSTWGQQDHMDAQLKKMRDTFVSRGYPVFVGEYGSVDKMSADSTNNRYRADYARTLVSTAKKYGAATAYWDNGYNGAYGFGLFNRSSVTVTQQGIIDAIISAVGGTTPTPPPTTAPPTTAPPTTRPPTTPPPSNGRSCSASYSVTGQWQGGFQAEVRVTAGGSAINGWTVTWTFANGQQVTQAWSATVTSSGTTVTARNVSYNGSMSAGGSTTFGFLGSSSGTNGVPSLSCAAS